MAISAQSGCRRPSGGGGGGEACPPLAVDDEGSDVQKVRPRPAILGPHPPFPLGGGRSPSLGIKCSGKTPSGPLAAADSAAGEGGSTAGAGARRGGLRAGGPRRAAGLPPRARRRIAGRPAGTRRGRRRPRRPPLCGGLLSWLEGVARTGGCRFRLHLGRVARPLRPPASIALAERIDLLWMRQTPWI